jgi:hypothetical protein
MYEENPAVVEASKPSYEFLETEVARLTAHAEYLSNRNRDYASEFNRKRDALEAYLDENWDDLGDHAEEIAGFFGIEVNKTVTVSMIVSFDVEVSVPRKAVNDLSEYDFDFDVSLNVDGDVEGTDSYVTTFEVSRD